jgi:hypothetical protein
MLSKASNKIKHQFLKEFTKELILITRHRIESKQIAMVEAERIRQEIAAEKLRQRFFEKKNEQELEKARQKGLARHLVKKEPRKIQKQEVKKKLMIHPAHVLKKPLMKPKQIPVYREHQLIKQAPEAQQLNLNKIHFLIADMDVSSIECQGEAKNIIIIKRGQTMRTEISLTKQEIDQVIQEFSDKARIPIIEGLLRARIGSLQISAVVSINTSSRFIITRRTMPMLNQAMPAPGLRPAMIPGARPMQRNVQQPPSFQQPMPQKFQSPQPGQIMNQQQTQSRAPQQIQQQVSKDAMADMKPSILHSEKDNKKE